MISVSSQAHDEKYGYPEGFRYDVWTQKDPEYNHGRAYSQSKLENIVFAERNLLTEEGGSMYLRQTSEDNFSAVSMKMLINIFIRILQLTWLLVNVLVSSINLDEI